MCYYIGIEDLAANALIECLKKETETRDLSNYVITYSNLEKYGAQVVETLNKKNEKAILIFGRDSTNMMFRSYSDFFMEKDSAEGKGISLREGKTVGDLIKRFRMYVSIDLLLSYMAKSSLSGIKVCNGR